MKYLFVSIPAFNHEVFKCAGMVPAEQLEFYRERFARGLELVSAFGSEPKEVLVMDSAPADRVTFVPERAALPTAPLTYRESGILLIDREN